MKAEMIEFMANNIKGITVEIGGDTTKLSTAMKDVNKETYSLQSELKQINTQLKFNPGSTELLAQKQKVLKESIDATKQKLEQLKSVESQVKQQFESGNLGEEKYRAFEREIEQTEDKLKSLKKQASEFGSVAGQKFQLAGEKVKNTGDKISGMGEKLLPVTGSVLAIGTAAVTVGDNFEAQMSRVKAISGATGSDFDKLRQQALDLGQSTAYSAGEVAQGMENLASAGFSTKEIMEAMPGMLNLAASSGEDLATSSDIAASTLRGFGLAASDAGHVADVLAQNAAKTNAAVADTGAAMKYIAPVAQNAGWSLEQVTAAIGEMADSGIKGEQAGTTLRGALTNLMNPSSTAADAMSSIGFSAYDSSGKMKSLSTIIQELGTKTKGLTDQQRDQKIATIMGTDALSGMQVLLKDGSGNLNQLTSALKNSNGAAQQMATTMQGNTKGAIEQMKGSLETAAIKIQTALAPTITKIATLIGKLVDKFSALSAGQQQQIVKIAAVVAAVGPALLIAGKMITAIGSIVKVVGMLMNPVGAVIAIIGVAVVAIKHLWDTNTGFRTAVINIWNGIKAFFSTIGTFFGTIFHGIVNAVKSVVTFFQTLPQFFSGLWTTITTALQSFWNSIVTFFTQGIPNFLNNLKTWFMKLPENIGYALGFAIGKLIKFGADAIAWAGQAIPQLINNIGTFFSQLPGKIWNFLVQAFTKVTTWGGNCISYVASNFPRFVQSVVSFFQQLPGRIWTELCKIVTNIGTWIGNMGSFIASNFPRIVSSIVGFFQSIPGKMLDIGRNIVTGIWNGISGAAGWLWNQITGFCNGIVNGIKSALGIHSPSRVMADVVGKNMVLGIGQGFANNMQSVTSTMSDSLHQSINGLTANVPVTANIGTGYYAGSPAQNTQSTAATVQPQYNINVYAQDINNPKRTAQQIGEELDFLQRRRAAAYGNYTSVV
ncbi:MAG: phage tail tape measure protein [Ruminococcaceae bacterium]|nr:phage tail tape measure protein [Oscillospiraceae bacterium]